MPLPRRHVGAGQPRRDFVARLALGHRQAAIEPVGGGQRLARRERSRPARRAPRRPHRDEPRSATPSSHGARPRARRRRGARPPPTAPPTPPVRRPAPGCGLFLEDVRQLRLAALRDQHLGQLAQRRPVSSPLRQARAQHLGRVAALLEQPAQANNLEAQRQPALAVARRIQLGDAQRDAVGEAALGLVEPRQRLTRGLVAGRLLVQQPPDRIAPGASCSAVSVSSAARRNHCHRCSSDTPQPRAIQQQRDRAARPLRHPRATCNRTVSSTACAAISPAASRPVAAVPCASRLPARSPSRPSSSIASASSASTLAAMPAASCRKSRLSAARSPAARACRPAGDRRRRRCSSARRDSVAT